MHRNDNESRVVAETTADKELVECLGSKFTVSSALCCVGGTPWAHVNVAVHILLDII